MSTLVVPDLIDHATRRFPNRACVITTRRTLTFAEVADRASRFANYLRKTLTAPGSRVALLADNVAEFIEIRVAAQRAGAILVPLNYRLSPAELQRMIDDCRPELLIVGSDCLGLAASLSGPPALELGLGESYEHALTHSVETWQVRPVEAAATCLINYTSGTTGEPKGVMLSNWSLHATMLACGAEIGAAPGDTYLASNPMFHLGTQVGLAFTYLGGSHAQLAKFGVDEFLDMVDLAAVTHSQLVPTMVKSVLAQHPERPGRLRRLLYGAAPMPPSLASEVSGSWGCELVNGYGCTEIMMVSSLSPEEHSPYRPELLASVGRSAVGMCSRLCSVDDDAAPVEVGEIGEVIAAGPTAMSGYWEKPAATAAAMSGDWIRTGDLGYLDADGYLYLVDRRADKIITGGENVYPREVEAVIEGFHEVDEVAVVGVPDEQWGQRIVAYVVPHPQATLDPADVVRRARDQLAGYKTPKNVVITDGLPRSPTGKILRRVLRELPVTEPD